MHIGYVLKKFPRASETFVLNEILALQRLGVEVTVFSLNRPDDGVFHHGLAALRRPVVYLPTRRPEAWATHLQQHAALLHRRREALFLEFEDLLTAARLDLWSVLGFGLDLSLMARDHGVQHLHVHFATVAANVARVAASVTGLPFSVTCHAKDIYRDGIVPGHFQSLLQRSAFAVTVCEANKRWIDTQLGRGARLDVRVLYNGVDTEVFHPRHRRPPATPTLLAVGRLVEKKGFHVLLDALALLAREGLQPRCQIVGDGEERLRLAAQVDRLGLANVEFTGMRTHEEVTASVHGATLMVLPCIVGQDGNRDALPTVLLEALAAGVPVISTPIGGVEEILDHGRAGVLVPPGESAPLAKAIAGLIGDPARSARLAAAGRAHAAARFDLDANVGRLREWFAHVQAPQGATA